MENSEINLKIEFEKGFFCTVLKTDTSRLVEKTKAFETTILKELCKLTLYLWKKEDL